MTRGSRPRFTLDLPLADHRATFVAGIGASTGGLEALEKFFINAPRESGLAYVFVQHLSPDFRSLMEDGMTVLPDRIYSGARLLLSERDRHQHELLLPVDVPIRRYRVCNGEASLQGKG